MQYEGMCQYVRGWIDKSPVNSPGNQEVTNHLAVSLTFKRHIGLTSYFNHFWVPKSMERIIKVVRTSKNTHIYPLMLQSMF